MTAKASVPVVREIVGHIDDEQFTGRRIERLSVSAARATRRRLRARTDAGTDIAADLPAGSYLHHGAVLLDDGERIVAVERPAELAAIIRLSRYEDEQTLMAQAVRLGHALGSMHAPIEVLEGEIRVPITSSRSVIIKMIDALQLRGVVLRFAHIALGSEQPLAGSSSERHHGRSAATPPPWARLDV